MQTEFSLAIQGCCHFLPDMQRLVELVNAIGQR